MFDVVATPGWALPPRRTSFLRSSVRHRFVPLTVIWYLRDELALDVNVVLASCLLTAPCSVATNGMWLL
jgi:hypothetical protein